MQDSINACIVTGYAPNTSHGEKCIGSPYKRGQERMVNSLIHHGFRQPILTYQDFPNKIYDTSCGYNIKASCMFDARAKGYDVLLWLDSSVWPIQAVEPIFDYILEHGWYFYSNGFDLGQTMNDKALEYFGLTREQGFKMPDLSSSMFGLHLGNPKGEHFLKDWLQSAVDGLWKSPRFPQPGDPPGFVGDRQDQSCATALMHKWGMDMEPRGRFSDIGKSDADLNGYNRKTIKKIEQYILNTKPSPERTEAIKLVNSLKGYGEECIFVMRGM